MLELNPAAAFWPGRREAAGGQCWWLLCVQHPQCLDHRSDACWGIGSRKWLADEWMSERLSHHSARRAIHANRHLYVFPPTGPSAPWGQGPDLHGCFLLGPKLLSVPSHWTADETAHHSAQSCEGEAWFVLVFVISEWAPAGIGDVHSGILRCFPGL